jgi:cullin 3
MIDGEKLGDISRMYRLFCTVPAGLPTLRKALKDSIVRRGKELNVASAKLDGVEDAVEEDVEDPKGKGKGKAKANPMAQTLQLALKWVEDALNLKDKFDQVWATACNSAREIESGINEVCTKY